MQATASDAVSHVAAQLTVGSTGIHIRAACPITQRIDFRIRVCSTELLRWRIALAEDQSIAVQNVFPVTAIFGIQLLCNPGELFLLFGNRRTTEDAVVATAKAMILIPGQVAVLRDLHIVHSNLSGNAIHSSFDFIKRQGDVRLRDDVADPMSQKNLDRDTRVISLGIRHIHDCTGNAVAQLVRMRRIHFFKHCIPSFHRKSPGRLIPPRLLRSFS